MNSTAWNSNQKMLGTLHISSPFTIPSGVVTTVPAVLARIARDVPSIGFPDNKNTELESQGRIPGADCPRVLPGLFHKCSGIG